MRQSFEQQIREVLVKPVLSILLISQLGVWTSASAQESLVERALDGRSNCLAGQADCLTAAGSAAGATAVTIRTVNRYRQARDFDRANTRALLQSTEGAAAEQVRTSSIVSEVADGDRVQIQWRLSDAANRNHHIQTMDSNASSAESNAHTYRLAAAAALIPRDVTKTDSYTDSNGQLQTRTYTVTEVDHAGYVRNMAMAAMEDSNAAEYRRAAADARRGGAVPIYRFDATVNEAQGNRIRAESLISEKLREGGRIFSVTRLPAAQFQHLRSLVRSARFGVVGAVGLGALAIEEALLGKVGQGLQQMVGGDQGSVWYPTRDADQRRSAPERGTVQTLSPNVTR